MLHDIVYFVKPESINEELRFSLRSVCENFPHGKVWFYGGKPVGLKPDVHILMRQRGASKWQRTTGMLEYICENDEITDDFWLFNDDFFVMEKPVLEPWHNGDLEQRICDLGSNSNYKGELKKAVLELKARGMGTLNYAVHVPMLVNRQKALETLKEFRSPMFRSLYGNMWEIGGIDRPDVKIFDQTSKWSGGPYLSTTDMSFSTGTVGNQIRARFPDKCEFEY